MRNQKRRKVVDRAKVVHDGVEYRMTVLVDEDGARPPMVRVRVCPSRKLAVTGIWGGPAKPDQGTIVEFVAMD